MMRVPAELCESRGARAGTSRRVTPMAQHPNSRLAEASWVAVANSDVDALGKLWADDIVWHATTRNPWAGVYVGRDAVLDYLARVGEAGEVFDARLDDVLVSDDHMMLLCHMQLRHGSQEVEVDQAILARIEKTRVAEVWVTALDPQAIETYWEKVAEENGKR